MQNIGRRIPLNLLEDIVLLYIHICIFLFIKTKIRFQNQKSQNKIKTSQTRHKTIYDLQPLKTCKIRIEKAIFIALFSMK